MNLVLDVVGAESIEQTVKATAFQGKIIVTGVLSKNPNLKVDIMTDILYGAKSSKSRPQLASSCMCTMLTSCSHRPAGCEQQRFGGRALRLPREASDPPSHCRHVQVRRRGAGGEEARHAQQARQDHCQVLRAIGTSWVPAIECRFVKRDVPYKHHSFVAHLLPDQLWVYSPEFSLLCCCPNTAS